MSYKFFLCIFFMSNFLHVNSAYRGEEIPEYYYSLITMRLEKRPEYKLLEELQRENYQYAGTSVQFIDECERLHIRDKSDYFRVERKKEREASVARAGEQNNQVVVPVPPVVQIAPVVQNSNCSWCLSLFFKRPQIHP